MRVLYKNILRFMLENKLIDSLDEILVVGGGKDDRDVIYDMGFKNVVISNLSPHNDISDYDPYPWKKININSINYNDNSFDWVFVSAALHHLHSPHKGLCEMLRVCKNGVLMIESFDNFLSKISRKIKLVPDYEVDAILKDGKGGVENSEVPNFIYRWNKSEVKKTVNSFLPHVINHFHFFHHYQFPVERLKRDKSFIIRITLPLLIFLVSLMKILLPKQANEFGCVIVKGKVLQPWLKGNLKNYNLNKDFIRKNYKTNL